jgi:hypothetical protein
VAIKEVLAQWTPRTIEVSILATQAAANSLLAANTIGILPERVRQQAAVEPLDCVGTLVRVARAVRESRARKALGDHDGANDPATASRVGAGPHSSAAPRVLRRTLQPLRPGGPIVGRMSTLYLHSHRLPR